MPRPHYRLLLADSAGRPEPCKYCCPLGAYCSCPMRRRGGKKGEKRGKINKKNSKKDPHTRDNQWRRETFHAPMGNKLRILILVFRLLLRLGKKQYAPTANTFLGTQAKTSGPFINLLGTFSTTSLPLHQKSIKKIYKGQVESIVFFCKAKYKHPQLRWIEQQPSKLMVVGSNPIGSKDAIYKQKFLIGVYL